MAANTGRRSTFLIRCMATIDYYNKNAEQFFHETVNINMEEFYAPFLSHVPKGGRILDAGCGSGRDSLYFIKHGYEVTAFDAAERLVEMSSKLISQQVYRKEFQCLDYEDEFDGIWACASLLHIPHIQIDDVFERLARALKVSGVLYVSFKYGDFEGEEGERFFNYYDETSFSSLLVKHPNLKQIRRWCSSDQRQHKHNVLWLNVLLNKV